MPNKREPNVTEETKRDKNFIKEPKIFIYNHFIEEQAKGMQKEKVYTRLYKMLHSDTFTN